MSYRNKRFNNNQDDCIDFPCSSTWRNHYADQGLTYPTSAPLPSSSDRKYQDLLHKIKLGRVQDQLDTAEKLIDRQAAKIERLEALLAKRPSRQPSPSRDAVMEGAFVEY